MMLSGRPKPLFFPSMVALVASFRVGCLIGMARSDQVKPLHAITHVLLNAIQLLLVKSKVSLQSSSFCPQAPSPCAQCSGASSARCHGASSARCPGKSSAQYPGASSA